MKIQRTWSAPEESSLGQHKEMGNLSVLGCRSDLGSSKLVSICGQNKEGYSTPKVVTKTSRLP